MFAGHVGAGLAIAGFGRCTNPAIYVLAACWLDVVLWLLVLGGAESVAIPPDYAQLRYLLFEFPYSHSLLAALAWSVVAALFTVSTVARVARYRRRVAILVATAVSSHWVLDALVHVPGLPLSGTESVRIGLSLWRNVPAALAAESALLVAGTWLYVAGAGLPGWRSFAVATVAASTLALTVLGMTIAPPPASIPVMATTSLLTIVAVCALIFWAAQPFGARSC